MSLRNELTAGFGLLLVVLLLTAFAAVGLLSRMTPAVEAILRDNVASIEAVEQMLAVLAVHDSEDPEQHTLFMDALQRATDNAIEEGESLLIEELTMGTELALAGDVDARRQVIAALQELGDIHRDAMQRANARAERLGFGGAWIAAILGLVGLFLGIRVSRRVERKVLAPIETLDETLRSVRKGNVQRRCGTWEAPDEIRRIAAFVDDLLDRHAGHALPGVGKDTANEHAALLCLLDREPTPAVLLDANERIRAVNRLALSEPPGRVVALTRGERSGWSEVDIEQGFKLLVKKDDPNPEAAISATSSVS